MVETQCSSPRQRKAKAKAKTQGVAQSDLLNRDRAKISPKSHRRTRRRRSNPESTTQSIIPKRQTVSSDTPDLI
ncbi:Uncharacterized protein HZ326_14308 [Fusarium oxysporum f. sp. albedinis]|nr:Uncharacterized protein HZ326_14308 [Fusarium oxysporum f. sp. albedinis]